MLNLKEQNNYKSVPFITLSLLFVIITFYVLSSTEYEKNFFTGKEFIDRKHQEDSIRVIKKSEIFAKNFVIEKLSQNNKKFSVNIAHTWRDDSLQSHLIHYVYVDKRKIIEQRKHSIIVKEKDIIDRYVWVRILFDSNNGDYKITPKIIRTAKRKTPREDDSMVEIEVIC